MPSIPEGFQKPVHRTWKGFRVARRPFVAIGIGFALLLTGCSLLPVTPSVSEPPLAYVWPLNRCPSDLVPKTYAEQHQKPQEFVLGIFAGALANVALGEVTSTIFGIPSQILSQAAKADKDGYTVSSTNSRLYYSEVTDTTDPKYGTKLQRLAPPACYVIAIYKSPDVVLGNAASWCDNKILANTVPDSCKNGKDMLDGLPLTSPTGEGFVKQFGLTTKNLTPPDFYIEVGFDEVAEVYGKAASGATAKSAATGAGAAAPVATSTTVRASIALPRAKALYYPTSLQTKASTKKRQITIGIVLSQVATYVPSDQGKARVTSNEAEKGGLLNVNFTLALNAEKPGATAADAKVAAYPQAWVLIPGLHDDVDVPVPSSSSPLTPAEEALNRVPVNVTVSVHEVGNPSIFLAALANATQTAGTDYSKSIVAAVLPQPGTLNAQQTDLKNQASVSALGASYSKDLASFWKECSKPLNTGSGETAYLNSLWQIVFQDYQQAIQTAAALGTTLDLQPTPVTRPKKCLGL
ncbi:MAG: hypothetical protein ABI171_06455 [Collimonas sp.]|uniref:hypothetical protein n=1 Tax=Collimonas sp. TaxID=1963772 RepID=UPI003266BBAF